MKRAWIAILVLLVKSHLVYAVKSHFYWMPHGSFASFFRDQSKLSGPLGGNVLCGGHYQLSKKLSMAFMGHFWSGEGQLEDGQYSGSDAYDLAVKMDVHSFRLTLLPKPITVYLQGGGWYACSTAPVIQQNAQKMSDPSEGSGLLFGIGADYPMSKIFIDVSYKRLKTLPILHTGILSTNLITVSLRIPLF